MTLHVLYAACLTAILLPGCRITASDVCDRSGGSWNETRRRCVPAPGPPPVEVLARVHEARGFAMGLADVQIHAGEGVAVSDAAGIARVEVDPGPVVVTADGGPAWTRAHLRTQADAGVASAASLCVAPRRIGQIRDAGRWAAVSAVDAVSFVFPARTWVDAKGTPAQGAIDVPWALPDAGSCATPRPLRSCDDVPLDLVSVAELGEPSVAGSALTLGPAGARFLVRQPDGVEFPETLRAYTFDVREGCWAERPHPPLAGAQAVEVHIDAPGWVALGQPSAAAGCVSGRLVDAPPGTDIVITAAGVHGARGGPVEPDGTYCFPLPEGSPRLRALGWDGDRLGTWVGAAPGNEAAGQIPAVWSPDEDGDGAFAGLGDCADADPARHAGASDPPGDGLDGNCDGVDGLDRDRDGYAVGADCDDTDPDTHPGAAEACDGTDNDCDGTVDGGLASALPGCVLDTDRTTSIPCTRQSIADLGPRVFWSMELREDAAGRSWVRDHSGFADDALAGEPTGGLRRAQGLSHEGGDVPLFLGRYDDLLRADHRDGLPTDGLTFAFWARVMEHGPFPYTAVDVETRNAASRTLDVQLGHRGISARLGGYLPDEVPQGPDIPMTPTPTLDDSGLLADRTGRWQHFAMTWTRTTVPPSEETAQLYYDGNKVEGACLPDPDPLMHRDDCYCCEVASPGDACDVVEADRVCPDGVVGFPAVIDDNHEPGARGPAPQSWLGQMLASYAGERHGLFAFLGVLDDVVLFDRPLAADEIRLLHDLTTCGEVCDGEDNDGDGDVDEGLLGVPGCPADGCRHAFEAGSWRWGETWYSLEGAQGAYLGWCEAETDDGPPLPEQFCGNGIVDTPGESMDDWADGVPRPLNDCTVELPTARSCLDVLALYPAAAGLDATYRIDLDGDGLVEPVGCEMTTDGGGWTLVLHHETRGVRLLAPLAQPTPAAPCTEDEQVDPDDPGRCLDCIATSAPELAHEAECHWMYDANRTSPRANPYSILGDLDLLAGAEGYDFMLRWPRAEAHGGDPAVSQRLWWQRSDPTVDTVVDGYCALDGVTDSSFSGLAVVTTPSQNCLTKHGTPAIDALMASGVDADGVPEFQTAVICPNPNRYYGTPVSPELGTFDGSTSAVELWVRPAATPPC